jgi:FlaA1/EpsC-like NDP-sugar epimerase
MDDYHLIPRGSPSHGRFRVSILQGANILITVATKSLGQKFAQALPDRDAPNRLVVHSRDEFAHFPVAEYTSS